MINLLNTLNPRTFFFTKTDFDHAIIDIQNLLKSHPLNPTEKLSTQLEWLEKAYASTTSCMHLAKKNDKQSTFLLSEIFKRYGYLYLTINPEVSRQFLLAAFNMYNYTIDLTNTCLDIRNFPSLESLKKQSLENPRLFEVTEDLILSPEMDCLHVKVYENCLLQSTPNKRMTHLAQILHWLGRSYQHIDNYCKITPQNDCRFIQLFNLSESLFVLANDHETNQELSELYYYSLPFMHERENPTDVDGTCAKYEKALFYDSSIEKQIKIAAMRFQVLFHGDNKKEAAIHIIKAFKLASTLPENQETIPLLADVYCLYGTYIFECATHQIELAENYLNAAIQLANKSRLAGYEQFRFAMYDIKIAELYTVMNNTNEAQSAIHRALNTLKKNPGCHQELLDYAKALSNVQGDCIL